MQPNALRVARNRLEWAETQAAQRLGVSQSYLAMLEAWQRRVTPRLARKFKAVYGLSPTALPTPDLFHPRVDVSGEEFASMVSALGYPGFAYMKYRVRERNPAEVLLEALKQDNLEPRVVEALPWLSDGRFLIPTPQAGGLYSASSPRSCQGFVSSLQPMPV